MQREIQQDVEAAAAGPAGGAQSDGEASPTDGEPLTTISLALSRKRQLVVSLDNPGNAKKRNFPLVKEQPSHVLWEPLQQPKR